MKIYSSNKLTRLLMGTVVCLSTFCAIFADVLDRNNPTIKKDDNRVHLIHSDVLYKTPMDIRADVLVGNVRLYHSGMYLDCDSARFFKDDNSFNAYGHVKMWQGDTLTLTCDTLLYDGYDMQAHTLGHSVLTHKKTKLVSDYLDYDRVYNVGMYPYGGTLYDGDNVLVSDWGQYTVPIHEAFFTNNVVLTNPKFKLVSDTLYYYSDIKKARIVSPTNITSDDGTFVYGERGDYDTNTDEAFLLDRSYIIKDMRKIVADSLYYCKGKDVSEAFGDVVITDEENLCMLTANYCQYNQTTGFALATDSAVAYEYSQKDTLYVHADTLKMFTYNLNTDSVYRDLHAYHHVRMYRVDVQAVCDSMVTHELDSCTYMYGNPVLWNEGQQAKGDEIRVYNNDSTIDWIHIIGKASTVEKIDSLCFNQIESKEMFTYFKHGQLDRNEAVGNVFVAYYMQEDDGFMIGMVYNETTKAIMYMENKKPKKIWMAGSTGTMYPPTGIPKDKCYLARFVWLDDIRPKDRFDIFNWRVHDPNNKGVGK